jgi:hypothetical protein
MGVIFTSVANLVGSLGLTRLANEPVRADNVPDVVRCTDIPSCESIACLLLLGSSDHSIDSFVFSLTIMNLPGLVILPLS